MPQVGFGTAAMHGAETRRNVRAALEAGFRHFDGAQATEWYDDVALGTELKAAMLGGSRPLNGVGISRSEIFVTSKVHPKRFNDTFSAVNEIIDNLQLEYVDLILLHFEGCWDGLVGCEGKTATWREAWPALVDMYKQGKIRAIGLSNAQASTIIEAAELDIKPHVVQNWMDPFHPDAEVRTLCDLYDIKYTAYSSLGSQWEYRGKRINLVRTSKVINSIAQARSVSWTEIALRWAMQHGVAVLPRSSSGSHTSANAKLLLNGTPLLNASEMRSIDRLATD